MSKTYGKQKVYELLESNGIAFEKLEHEAVYTMEDMEKEGIVGKGTVCKNLFLRDAKGKNHYCNIFTAGKPPQPDSRFSFLSRGFFCAHEAVSILQHILI